MRLYFMGWVSLCLVFLTIPTTVAFSLQNRDVPDRLIDDIIRLQREGANPDYVARLSKALLEEYPDSGPAVVIDATSDPEMVANWPEWQTLIVEDARLTGYSHGQYPSFTGRTHPGIDIGLPGDADCGVSKIISPLAGTIVRVVSDQVTPNELLQMGVDADRNARDFSKNTGNAVMLRHQLGGETVYTIYLHMSSAPSNEAGRRWKPGESVKAGDQLGLIGKTGNADGCHLHFEARRFEGLYKYLHPDIQNIYPIGNVNKTAVFGQDWLDPDAFLRRAFIQNHLAGEGSPNQIASKGAGAVANRGLAYQDIFLSTDEVEVRVTETARRRNYPSTEGTTILDELAPGTAITGRWVKDIVNDRRWLKVNTGGYVWDGVLASVERNFDQASYCAANPNGELPVNIAGYLNDETPLWLRRALGEDGKDFIGFAELRCKGGRVLACRDYGVGAVRPCAMFDDSGIVTESIRDWCREYPGRSPPFAVTGQSTFDWSCNGKRPVRGKNFAKLDADKFAPDAWIDVTRSVPRKSGPRFVAGKSEPKLTDIEDYYTASSCRLSFDRSMSSIFAGMDYENLGNWDVGINGQAVSFREQDSNLDKLVSSDGKIIITMGRRQTIKEGSHGPSRPYALSKLSLVLSAEGVLYRHEVYQYCSDH